MKTILLAITVSLMVPAYAEPTLEECDALKTAADKMSDMIAASKGKPLPLDDATKAEMKQALDNFHKAMEDFYEIDNKKVAKKKGHPKLKSIGVGLLAGFGALRSTTPIGYGTPLYTGVNSPLIPNMLPMPNYAPQFINVNGQPGTIMPGPCFTTFSGPAFR